jgi:UDP-N-acetyl-D-galactosamine dehydrogenase
MVLTFVNTSEKIAVIGLGYVGLPLAVALGRAGWNTVGFDIDQGRVEELRSGQDRTKEVEPEKLKDAKIAFEFDADALRECTIYILALPTPVTHANVPDLSPLLRASEMIAPHLKPNDMIVVESTVYPGVTEDEVGQALARMSGLKLFDEIKLAYSPERINPGDKVNTLENIVKVVSAQDAESLDRIDAVYSSIIKAGTHRASSIKVAEASKVIENTQRDINIALMNELAMMFDRLEIPSKQVFDAAATKWNFVKFSPGLVGGHCIGVDPYYLTHCAEILGYHQQIITSGRRINDSISDFLANKALVMLNQSGNMSKGTAARILVMGITFKENVPDIRNSKVEDMVKALMNMGFQVDVADAEADPDEVRHEMGLNVIRTPKADSYECVVFAVPHDEYCTNEFSAVRQPLKENGVLIDVKSMMSDIVDRDNLRDLYNYWSL